jgi:hypothetical protein
MPTFDRRTALRYLLASAAWAMGGRTLAAIAGAAAPTGNFRAIYSNPKLRDQFYFFLKNVFHLYPEERFHELIVSITSRYATDQEIYEEIQRQLPTIKPPLSELTYAVPALIKQKKEMARQTADLLGAERHIQGYVEIGTPGRYVKALRDRLHIRGTVYLVNDVMPGLALEDIVERGQLRSAGGYVPLGNYDPLDGARIPNGTIDLVTNFIGFHHAPAERLDPFVASIRRVLRPGGRLVVRDHDVDGPEMNAMVGLAHDVFNAGVKLTWRDNHEQIRNFQSIAWLEQYLAARGLERSGGTGLQAGDPTRNTLLMFVKRA